MNRAVLLCLLAAATQERAAFDVASVKIARPSPGPLRVTVPETPGGINYTNVTLKNCIRRVYGVRPDQIVGGPAWLDTERFLIDAKTATPSNHQQLMRMLQTLLEDRFHLVAHREQKEMPIYELTVAKNGPKLKPAKDDNTQVDSNSQHALIATAVSMSFLAAALHVDRPIYDATGLTGLYDITLDYDRDDPFGAFTALQAVGLKLEPRNRMMEVLTVESAEKPAAN